MPKVVTIAVPWNEVRVGDDLHFLSKPYRITHIRPYTHPVVTGGETWAIAYAGDPQKTSTWGITLSPGSTYDVVRIALEKPYPKGSLP